VIFTDHHVKTALSRNPSGRTFGALQQSGILYEKKNFPFSRPPNLDGYIRIIQSTGSNKLLTKLGQIERPHGRLTTATTTDQDQDNIKPNNKMKVFIVVSCFTALINAAR
jgi:hypothetical protein